MTSVLFFMKVIHIIPSAFEYFDDIRSRAFKLLDSLHKLGVETEAFTLQYGQPNKATKASVQEDSPAVHNFLGNVSIDNLIENLADFDIVHLHCPFLGAAKKIIDWKKTHPDVPLVITYYRDVRLEDAFSWLIKLYNRYYLPKIFALSDMVICYNLDLFQNSAAARYMSAKNNIAVVDEIELNPEWGKLNEMEAVAAKTIMVYNNLVS